MAYIKHFLSSKVFIFFALIVTGALIFFKGCQATKEPKSGALEYQVKKFELPAGLPDTIPYDIDTTVYRVEYVEFNEDTLNRWIIKNLLFNEEANSIAEDADLLFSSQSETEQIREGEPFPWRATQKLTVDHNHEHYIGFTLEGYSYTGGAHGSYYTIFKHWDPVSKKEILTDALFNENKREELNTVAEAAFREKFKIDDSISLSEEYFFEDGNFSLPENVRIEQNGDFTFLYNIYEILPYVNGITELEIPAQDMKPFLSEKGQKILKATHNHSDTKTE